MVTLDPIQRIIERAAEAGFVLVRACDLNEETQAGENLGSSGVHKATANGIILRDAKRNGN